MKIDVNDLARISIKPGEILAVSLPANTSQSAYEVIRAQFDRVKRENDLTFPILFMTDQVNLGVIRDEGQQ